MAHSCYSLLKNPFTPASAPNKFILLLTCPSPSPYCTAISSMAMLFTLVLVHMRGLDGVEELTRPDIFLSYFHIFHYSYNEKYEITQENSWRWISIGRWKKTQEGRQWADWLMDCSNWLEMQSRSINFLQSVSVWVVNWSVVRSSSFPFCVPIFKSHLLLARMDSQNSLT